MSDPQPPGWGAPPPAGEQSAFGSVPPAPPSGQYGAPPPGQYGGQYGAPQQPWAPPQLGANDNAWIVGAHVGALLLGFIAPLVVLLTEGKNRPLVRANAVEALNFQITLLIGWVVAFVTMFVGIGFLLMIVLFFAHYGLPVYAAVKSANGLAYRYPLTLRLVK